MSTAPETKRTWAAKFRDAFRGVRLGVAGQSSFLVHGLVTAIVLIAGVALRVSRTEWCLLTLCIASVLVAELFNSALEWLAKAIDEQPNQALGAALDIASGAVLLAATGAATVGAIVFVPHFWRLLIGWACFLSRDQITLFFAEALSLARANRYTRGCMLHDANIFRLDTQ